MLPATCIPNTDRIKPKAVRRATLDHLLARRRRLHLTNPYYAASTDGPRSDLVPRARELWAIETELVRRGALPDDGMRVLTDTALHQIRGGRFE